MLPVLFKWTAKRAGGRITIYHSTGKIVGIDKIELVEGDVVATTNDGDQYKLSLS